MERQRSPQRADSTRGREQGGKAVSRVEGGEDMRKVIEIIPVIILALLEVACNRLEEFFDKASNNLYRATNKVFHLNRGRGSGAGPLGRKD